MKPLADISIFNAEEIVVRALRVLPQDIEKAFNQFFTPRYVVEF